MPPAEAPRREEAGRSRHQSPISSPVAAQENASSGRQTSIRVSREPLIEVSGSAPEFVDVFVHSYQKSLRAGAKATRKMIKASLRDVAAWRQRVTTLEDKHRALCDSRPQRIRDICDKAQEFLDARGVAYETEDAIRAVFGRHMAKIHRWVAEYGILDGAACLDQASKNAILAVLTPKPHAVTSPDRIREAFEQDVPATVFLQALVSKIVSQRLLSSPFFFLDGVDGEQSGQSAGDRIRDIYNLGHSVDAERARIWRSQTIALLHPRNTNDMADSATWRAIRTSATAQYTSCAQSVLSLANSLGLLKELVKDDQATRADAVLDVVAGLGDFVLWLATRKEEMRVVLFGDAESARVLARDERYQTHPSSGLDDSDQTRGSRKILLVVEPLIQAFGDGEGGSTQGPVVWHSSKVVVSRPLGTKTKRNSQSSTTRTTSRASLPSGHEDLRGKAGAPQRPIIKSQPSQPTGESVQVGRKRKSADPAKTSGRKRSKSCQSGPLQTLLVDTSAAAPERSGRNNEPDGRRKRGGANQAGSDTGPSVPSSR